MTVQMKVMIDVELPNTCEGYRVSGVGRPKVGQWFFCMAAGGPKLSKHNYEYYAILLMPLMDR